MPLAYTLAHLVAFISPTDRPAHFRVVPWLSYVFVALLLARSTLFRNRLIGAASAATFLVLGSLLLPLYHGHMLLADGLWGVGMAAVVLGLLLPLLIDGVGDRVGAALCGAGAVLALGSNLIAIYPLAAAALLVGTAAGSSRERGATGRALLPFLAAGLAAATLTFVWIGLYGSVAGFLEEAISFNTRIYGPLFNPEKASVLNTVGSTARDWVTFLSFRDERLFALLGVVSAVGLILLCVGSGHSRARKLTLSLLFVALIALCRVRGGASRGLGYDVVVLAIVAVLAGRLLEWHRNAGVAFLLATITAGVAVAARHPSFAASPDFTITFPPEASAAARYIRDHTTPDDRIASFNSTPGLYLIAQRRPATGALFFYPWQAEWERVSRARPDTCTALQKTRPRFVFLFPFTIWGAYPFPSYAPCVDDVIHRAYRTVPGPELGGMLWEIIEPAPPSTVPPR